MIRHVAGIAEIVEDVGAAAAFYRDQLGLEVEGEAAEGYFVVKIAGVLHFGIWSRARAAQVVFGDPGRSEEIPLGFTVGLEVDSVSGSEALLRQRGVEFVQPTREESWGQTTARFLFPGGGLGEISETPWARELPSEGRAGATAG